MPKPALARPPPTGQTGRKGCLNFLFARALVDAQGSVVKVEVEKAAPAGYFEDAAIAAVKTWTFDFNRRKPGVTEEWVLVPINFRAEDNAPDPAWAPEGALDTLTIKGG